MDLRHMAELPLRRRLHHLVLHLEPPGPDRLPVGRFEALAQEVGSLLWLDINGGDPFAHADLAQLVGAFRCEIMTLITPAGDEQAVLDGVQQVRRVHQGELVVALQLDGLLPAHERRHGQGSWDRAWRTFDRLRKLDHLRVELRTRVSRANAHEVVALAEYAWHQGPDAHVVTLPLAHEGEAPEVDNLRVLEGPLFAVLDRYSPADGRLLSRMRRNFHRMRWSTAVRTLLEGRQVIPCVAGLSHAVVRANGEVASCDLLPALGSLRTQRWSEIWSGAALQAQREYIGAGACHCTDDCALHDSVLRAPNLPRLLAGSGRATLGRPSNHPSGARPPDGGQHEDHAGQDEQAVGAGPLPVLDLDRGAFFGMPAAGRDVIGSGHGGTVGGDDRA